MLLGVGVIVFLIAGALLNAPPKPRVLESAVEQNLGATGLANPVTGVLLDFRAYDTFLELFVMFVAMLGTWSLGRSLPLFRPSPAPALGLALKIVIPMSIIFSAYLLWIGATEPGGAFQAGAVLAGAGVMAVATGIYPKFAFENTAAIRVLLVLGVVAFLAIGLVVKGFDNGAEPGSFLDYPDDLAKWLILAIETAAMVAIAATLLALFRGGALRSGQAADTDD